MPDEAFLLGMPGRLRDGAMTVKVVTVFESHDPSHLATIGLYDPRTGACRAFMDGTYITAIRTSAAAAVATDLLAREDAPHAGDHRRRRAGRAPPARLPARARVRRDPRQLALRARTPSGRRAASTRARGRRPRGRGARRGRRRARHPRRAARDRAGAGSRPARTSARSATARRTASSRARCSTRRAVRRDARGVRADAGRLRRARRARPAARPSSARSCSAARPAARARDEITVYKAMGHVVEDIVAAELVYAAALETRAGQAGRAVGSAGAQGTRHLPARGLLDPRLGRRARQPRPAGRIAQLAARGGVGRPPLDPVRRAGAEGRAGPRGPRPARVPLQRPPHAGRARRARASPQALADRLVAPWQGISDAHRAVLRERTLRILTQGHLRAAHVLPRVPRRRAAHGTPSTCSGWRRELSPSPREEQLSYVEIAGAAASPPSDSRRACVPVRTRPPRRDRAARGVADGGRPDARAGRSAGCDCWLRRPPPGDDPANPYGKNRFLHGAHASGLALDRRAAPRRRPARRPLPARPAQVLLADPTEVVMRDEPAPRSS